MKAWMSSQFASAMLVTTWSFAAAVPQSALAGTMPASVPLELTQDNHLTVPARVNGAGPFPFILDTGADNAAVYEWFAKERKFPAQAPQELSGQTGTVSTPMYNIMTLSIGGRSMSNVLAYGLPNRHDRGEEAGVAGNDFMDGAVVAFDFPCGVVEIHPKPAALEDVVPKNAIPVRGGTIQDGTLLTLTVQIEGSKGIAFLDTGSRDTRISPQFAAAAGIDPFSSAFRDGEPIYGANSKPKASRIGPVGRVQFTGVSVANAEARVMDLPAFRSAGVGDSVMILGVDLMRAHRLVYDHQTRRFWFGASTCPLALVRQQPNR